MIDRYLTPEMKQLWSEEYKFKTWLRVEQAIAQAQAQLGVIPKAAARAIRRARFDLRQIERFEAETRHDVIGFLRSVETSLGRHSGWLHFGLTSYDIVDTALALRCREAISFLLIEAGRLRSQVRRIAIRHKHTPMIGRTHGIHAEPITFGLKCLSWYQEIRRSIRRLEQVRVVMSYGKVSGAVGTYSQLSPRIESLALKALRLTPEPVSTQVVPRDRLAELVLTVALFGAALERIALEIRNLQRTEIGEVQESFARGQRGSSAMPHKRNPIVCEQVCGLARVLRANAIVALENIPLWHERDLSNSSAERIIVPDSVALLHYLLRRMATVITGLHVDRARMQANLAASQGQFFSQRLMLALVRSGLSRDQAYRLCQDLAFQAAHTGTDFAQVCGRDGRVTRCLNRAALRRVFDLGGLLRNVDYVFRRSIKRLRRKS